MIRIPRGRTAALYPDAALIDGAARSGSKMLTVNILLIDDDLTYGELLVSSLSSQSGIRVSQAASLAAAAEQLDAKSFDLVFLDLGLPDGDGFEWFVEAKRSR